MFVDSNIHAITRDDITRVNDGKKHQDGVRLFDDIRVLSREWFSKQFIIMVSIDADGEIV